MPEERAFTEEEVTELVRAIVAGEDAIEVPPEMLVEPEAPPPRSLYAEIIGMTIGQTRMERDSMGEMSVPAHALYGASTQRAVLNFPVSGYRFSNPRIGEDEVIAVTRNKSADDELLRMITERREWMRNYQVRLGVATNPKARLPVALKQVGTLDVRDLRLIAKSRNVPAAIAAQARRILMTTKAPK